jgi:hypothetical protein
MIQIVTQNYVRFEYRQTLWRAQQTPRAGTVPSRIAFEMRIGGRGQSERLRKEADARTIVPSYLRVRPNRLSGRRLRSAN